MIYDMRCCGLAEPAGIDQADIEFSWKSSDYMEIIRVKILVSSTLQKCEEEEGDLWDSGFMETQGQIFWKYRGENLNSHCIYYWRVILVRMVGGELHEERSAVEQFLTGISQDEWKGKWISPESSSDNEIYAKEWMYIKELPNQLVGKKVFAYVASFGYHALYINGKAADSRVLAPARKNCAEYRTAAAVAYDITEYIREGKNEIRILANAGWTRAERKIRPALNVQIYTENGAVEVHTDSSWKVFETGNTMSNRYQENGADNPFGWTDFGNEEIYNPEPAVHDVSETGRQIAVLFIEPKMDIQKTERDVILKKIDPVSIEQGDVLRVDMGENYTGFLCIKTKVYGKRRITVKVSDKIEENMSFNQQTNYYVSEGHHILRGHFQYTSGRYYEISGFEKVDQVEKIQGLMIGPELRWNVQFRCSDPVINRIFDTDLHTFLSCTVGGVTMDCPHRERLGYGETGINTLIGCGLPCFETAAFYKNYFEIWLESQTDSGYFPHVVPDYHGGGGTAWSSFPVVGFYYYWKIYRDKECVRKFYPALKAWCEYLYSKCSDNLLTRYEFGEWDFLGDWAAPERNDWGDSEEALFFNNVFYALILHMMIELARCREDAEDERLWKERYCALSDAINDKYFCAEENYYCRKDAKYLALAILSGVVPDDCRERIYKSMLDIVKEKGFLDGGSAGNTFLLEVMSWSEEGNSLVYQWLHRTESPSYLYFLKRGETTWPEMWDVRNIYGGSRIHTCYTGIAGWIIYGLVGLNLYREDAPRYSIKPYLPEDLEWIELEYETPLGKMRFNWKREDNDVNEKSIYS